MSANTTYNDMHMILILQDLNCKKIDFEREWKTTVNIPIPGTKKAGRRRVLSPRTR
jgi:hypothetical protein